MRRSPYTVRVPMSLFPLFDSITGATLHLLAALLAFGAFAKGGFYPVEGAVVGGGAALLGLLSFRRSAIRGAATPLVAFLLPAVAIAVCVVVVGGEPLPAMSGLAALAGGFLVARGLLARSERATLVSLLSWTGAVVGALATVGLAHHLEPWGMFATWIWRGSSTFSYANAAGAFLVLTLPAAMLVQATRPGAQARLATFAISLGAMTTLSRGALLAAIIGAATLVALGGGRLLQGSARPILGAAVGMAGLLPGVVGDVAYPLVAWPAIAAGATFALLPAPKGRWVARGLLVAVLAGAAVTGTVAGPTLLRSRAGEDPRIAQWGAAVDAAAARPLFGVGLGRFRADGTTRFAHNEYLHVLAETGVVGLGSVVGAMTLLGAWAWSRRHAGRGDVWAASIAVAAGFSVHSAVDFLWRFPALLMVVGVWIALADEPAPLAEGERR